jgi:murein DD-endopeptidase MepM/ murein hydrolase activator NlpD
MILKKTKANSIPGNRLQFPSPSVVPIEIEVPFAPIPAKGNGKTHLAYELHITNFRPLELTLIHVDVFADDLALPLIRMEGKELKDCLFQPGISRDSLDVRLIKGGMRTIVYMWITLEREEDIPNVLYHRLFFTFTNSDGKAAEGEVDGGLIAPVLVESPCIGSPVGKGDWLAANGPSNVADHRRALVAMDGKARIAQRFGIDLMKFGEDGKPVHGDPSENENWKGYGEELLAAADATVVVVNDGVPENVPLASQRSVRMTRKNICGNYVILDLGKNHFAFYGHMQPGSLRVKAGDRLHRGDIIGRIGNSGNSDAPHLHFHIIDAGDPLAAEGLPFLFDSFAILRVLTLQEMEDLIAEGISWRLKHNGDTETVYRQLEIPMGHAVIRFE